MLKITGVPECFGFFFIFLFGDCLTFVWNFFFRIVGAYDLAVCLLKLMSFTILKTKFTAKKNVSSAFL